MGMDTPKGHIPDSVFGTKSVDKNLQASFTLDDSPEDLGAIPNSITIVGYPQGQGSKTFRGSLSLQDTPLEAKTEKEFLDKFNDNGINVSALVNDKDSGELKIIFSEK